MTAPSAPRTRLADYRPYPQRIEAVELTFRLHPTATRVLSRIRLAPVGNKADLALDGQGLKLISARIDGQEVDPEITADGLRIPAADLPDGPFLWEAEVEISPQANTALEGLYLSNGMYCTQCEAEGFRHITYYPDRPDVMAVFSVRIESDLPVMLSNGNPVARGRDWAEWHDPWPKPAYLFALVAGELVSHDDSFTTAEGRAVDLRIWTRAGDRDQCGWAMDALKRSMAWDERAYGRAYDLDLFQIVAVDDFNMGAMENKGLNIFNSRYVLVSPETATDADYDNVERIIAHEYFHNWTGNRITCRDWFQLSLKEGLTVFRDQQFSADERGAALRRIRDVEALRGRQFREDAGPLAHPVRPPEYEEINNFYTATIYEKGAEVIRMLHRLVGPDDYRRALDLYFDRHDGQACTIEDWLKVFTDATGRDLAQFKLWYQQAGTPRLAVTENWDGSRYRLTFRQHVPDTPGQTNKAPMVIPVALALFGPNGDEVMTEQVLEITETEQGFEFAGMGARPVPSLLRGFSAPVILEGNLPDPAFLLAHETDPFNRYEAARSLGLRALIARSCGAAGDETALLDGLGLVLRDEALDPAFRAICLALPGAYEVAAALHDAGQVPDPSAIWKADRDLGARSAGYLEADLAKAYDAMADTGAYSPDPAAAARRALRHAALRALTRLDGGTRARDLLASARCMTESAAAMGALIPEGLAADALAAFFARWKGDRLVIDKWFSMQVGLCNPARAVTTAKTLAAHPAFDWKNPNRFRALLGGLAGNLAGFHDPSGAGYRFYADWLIRLDPVNPQTTARMCSVFETWRIWDASRQALIGAELSRIAATKGLSRNTAEMVGRIRGKT